MITQEIKTYVENKIIPIYNEFDKAHNLDHVQKVIENSFSICAQLDVNLDMVYVIAAYHDIGLKNGRENNEKSSSKVLVDDSIINSWFSDIEIAIMSEAVEDHRASIDYEPRSLYGKIIAEADRDIDYYTIIKRTVLYSLKNYPDYDFEQHFDRTYEHIQDKYGENGYLKLWLNTEFNENGLRTIREALKSKEKFKIDFREMFLLCVV